MKKNFYKNAALAVLSTALLSVLFSLLYYITETAIDFGGALPIILYYLKVIFDMTATFVGYTTIVYAVTKFGWFEGVASTIDGSDISLDPTVVEDESLIDFILFNTYYSFGQLFITLMIPAALIAFMSYKMIKKDETPFKKVISFKNPVQKTMILFCIILFAVNYLVFLSLDILPFLIEEEFYITYSDFKTIILQSLISLGEMSVSYIVLQYIVFMLTFKYYDKVLDIKHNTVADKK